MAQEPDVIRQQIEETRSSLTDKIETLEEQVRATVEGAKATVEGTIENVKETVEGVKESVQDTITNVKDSMHDTVQSVKQTLDLRYQTERHPWAMVAGSLAAGFVVGNLIEGQRQQSRRPFAGTPANLDPWRTEQRAVAADRAPRAAAVPAPARPGLTDKLMDQFGDEINMVKDMAVAALMGLARDMAKQYLPQLGPQIDRVMNNATRKFGAEPVHQSMVDPAPGAAPTYR